MVIVSCLFTVIIISYLGAIVWVHRLVFVYDYVRFIAYCLHLYFAFPCILRIGGFIFCVVYRQINIRLYLPKYCNKLILMTDTN